MWHVRTSRYNGDGQMCLYLVDTQGVFNVAVGQPVATAVPVQQPLGAPAPDIPVAVATYFDGVGLPSAPPAQAISPAVAKTDVADAATAIPTAPPAATPLPVAAATPIVPPPFKRGGTDVTLS